MKEITQQNKFKSLTEHIIRSNLFLFIIFRYLAGKLLTRFAHETDFELFEAFNQKDGLFLDVGANDGISVRTFKIYNKRMRIFSVEINDVNRKYLERLKKAYPDYNYIITGASNKNTKKTLYQAYFKSFHLSPFDSLSSNELNKSLNENLFDEKRKKKIYIKKKDVKLIKLDELNLKTSIIKVDIQGHEYECIQGLKNTIAKYRPAILLEYNKDTYKIIKFLDKFNLKPYYYRSKTNTIYKLNNEKPFGIFMLNDQHLKIIRKKFKLN